MEMAKEIINAAGFCDNPNYYSGYPASAKELSGYTVFHIYENIQFKVGENAARNFAETVLNFNLPLTLSNFIYAILTLAKNGWVNPILPLDPVDFSNSGFTYSQNTSQMLKSNYPKLDESERIKNQFKKKLKFNLDVDKKSYVVIKKNINHHYW